MLKSKRGISITTLVITVMVLMVIMGTVIYSAVDSVKIRKLNKLYGDLRQLEDAVEIYYLKHGELPIDTNKQEITISKNETKASIDEKGIGFVLSDFDKKEDSFTVTQIKDFFNPNDCVYSSSGIEKATYKFLKLSLIENIDLNYQDNEYIVNTQSHTVYNFSGIKLDGNLHHSLPLKYKDTKYNEAHPVSEIKLKNVSGITDVNNKIVYYAINRKDINLKDLLVFNTDSNNDLGKPKTVTFMMKNNSGGNYDNFELNSETGILSKKSSSTIIANSPITINVKVTNYETASTPEDLELVIDFSGISLEKNSNKVNNVNLLATHNEETYIDKKTTDTGYNLSKSNNLISVEEFSLNTEVASAVINENGYDVVFNSKNAGTTNIDFNGLNLGKPKYSVKVNVFDYQIYNGVGNTININELSFNGIEDEDKNIRLNIVCPDDFDVTSPGNDVIWKIVKKENSNYVVDNSTGIVSIEEGTGVDKTKVKITPQKIGKTYLRCTFIVNEEVLGESVIPIIVSGLKLVSSDGNNKSEITAPIEITSTDNSAVVEFVFGDGETSATFETPVITNSDFSVTKKTDIDNQFEIKYNGTSSEATSDVTITAIVGEKTYTDKITINYRDGVGD